MATGRPEQLARGKDDGIFTPEPCNADQPASSVPAPEAILEQLSRVITEAQSALLAGRLHDLDSSLAEQLELCRQFQSTVTMTPRSGFAHPLALEAAKSAQQQLRIFSAMLRRSRQTITAFHNAFHSASLTYAPSVSGKHWSR